MDPVLARMAENLRGRYGKHLHQILFFGSRARGDALPESDYDCLLVFDAVTPSLKADLSRLASEWLLEKSIVFSCVALSESDLSRLRYEPFVQNAYREGIAA